MACLSMFKKKIKIRRRENTKLLLRPRSLANLPLASQNVCSFSLGLLEYHLNGRQKQAVLFMAGSSFSLKISFSLTLGTLDQRIF